MLQANRNVPPANAINTRRYRFMDSFIEKSIWINDAAQINDQHVAFRGTFELPQDGEVEIRSLGASWYEAFIDGEFVFEGPLRYPAGHPEYDRTRIALAAGHHVLAVHVHHLGVETRLLAAIDPFLCIEISTKENPDLPIAWRCRELPGFARTGRRLNPELAWIQWEDTRKNPNNWQAPDFEDKDWMPAHPMHPKLGTVDQPSIASVSSRNCPAQQIAHGPLAEKFGYAMDDIPARFFLRDLECRLVPPTGIWRRYDLGRVRLARPDFMMDLPAGTQVEFAYCEALEHGRVSPYITLSDGASCNLDHFVARGGMQQFRPLHSKGGRFVELHIWDATPEQIHIARESFVERSYYSTPTGAFACDDDMLNRIWEVGCATYMACSEDALVDNPTRERGQWNGDLVSVGLDIGAVLFPDLRLIRRGLRQCAECHSDDGLVAGLAPGQTCVFTSYAAQWSAACLHYWELTGDRALLEEFYPYAVANSEAFLAHLTADGIGGKIGKVFIDWGYRSNAGPSDMALNLHCLAGLKAMVRWCAELGHAQAQQRYQEAVAKLENAIRDWLTPQLQEDLISNALGYHCLALAMRVDLVPASARQGCIEKIKKHLLAAFPNNPDGLRNANPALKDPRLITPYFAHFAFPMLIENGEMDFVLDQYRTCWGWALQEDRTTWVEVFDTRWSHCHQWSGCPTWQLSRYVLGLHPRYDQGVLHFDFNFHPGSLKRAAGRLPLPGSDDCVSIQWELRDGVYEFRFDSAAPLTLLVPDGIMTQKVVGFRFFDSKTGTPWPTARH
jgi:hypothetical protein